MTESMPQPKENFVTKLKTRIGEMRNEAVASWKSMDARDAIKSHLTGGALAVGGILLTVGGRAADLWVVEGLGKVFAVAGAGSMLLGYAKLVELGIKEQIATRQAK